MKNRDIKMPEFQVDEESDLPLWVQLRKRLAYLITSKFYGPGEQLPTVRALAAELSINYNTVNKAYLGLKSDGYIESSPGRGAFVRSLDGVVDEELSSLVNTVVGQCIAACRDLGLSLDDVAACVNDAVRQLKREEEGEAFDEVPPGRIVTIHPAPLGRHKNAK